jgi:hypothetical protein
MAANDEPIDDEELLALTKVHFHPSGKPNRSAIANAMGKSESGIRRSLARIARKGLLTHIAPAMPGFEITKVTSKQDDGSYVTQKPEADDLKDKIPEGHIVERSTLKIGDDWYKTRLSHTALTREAIEEMFEDYRGKSEILLPPARTDPTRLAFYPTADIHLGLLAWHRDSERDWDLAIAERELLKAHSDLIRGTPSTQTAILLDLGDQFHMNDQTNATPMHKHRLDVDGRFPKVAKTGVKIRKAMIEMALQNHERVIYRGVPGNHDPEAQMWLSIALSCFFENNPRVIIDDDPSEFWFYEFGKTFLAANHGHKVKPNMLPGIMAADRPEIWGRTRYKYAFSGHIHREKSGEELGVAWETMRTINPGDNYSHTGGWRSGHELTSITFSAETGRGPRQYVPV